MFKWKFLKLNSFQIILAGFLVLILTGTLLLCLPIASAEGIATPFFSALFTACSASCVTGLVVLDTATYWSVFGKCVIICLIQIGGLGVITMSTVITIIMGRKISLFQRSMLRDSISADQLGGIVRLTRFIVKGTIIFELSGAVLLYPVFYREFGPLKAIPLALFHSISAFCNAGFDLMGERGAFSSFTTLPDNVLLNIVFMLLIVIGGLGFLTWSDIVANKGQVRKYRLQSRMILVVTVLLIFIPALWFFIFEFGDLPLKQRLLYSMFQSVTTRTAGFNTYDQAALSSQGMLLTICLMLVGGAPGSTAGGMKITTLAVLLIAARSVFKRSADVNFMGRRIPAFTVRSASGILTLYLTLFISAGCLIGQIEGLPLGACLYETASAIGTVGLTTGITPGLSTASGLILVFLMVIGRVGGLTMIFAAVPVSGSNMARLPEEPINVG
ncbi:MAG: Trk family potassium uptake protein [Firmicutes bacterium]|nr:Trk family potassium uptake protein [Bacillota bacterium]